MKIKATLLNFEIIIAHNLFCILFLIRKLILQKYKIQNTK